MSVLADDNELDYTRGGFHPNAAASPGSLLAGGVFAFVGPVAARQPTEPWRTDCSRPGDTTHFRLVQYSSVSVYSALARHLLVY